MVDDALTPGAENLPLMREPRVRGTENRALTPGWADTAREAAAADAGDWATERYAEGTVVPYTVTPDAPAAPAAGNTGTTPPRPKGPAL